MLYTVSAIMVLAIVVLSITYLSFQLLLFLLFPVYLLYGAIELRLDFRDGLIKEMSLMCYNVQRIHIGNGTKGATRVSFRTVDDVPTYYTFTVPSKKAEFYLNCPYLVYVHEKRPHLLYAYCQI